MRRENKIQKRRNGMRISNRSIFTLEEIKKKKAEEIRMERERLEKEERLNSECTT
jgi:hypothetical protein